MVEVESLSYEENVAQQSQSILDLIQSLKNQVKPDSTDAKMFTLLRLKAYTSVLSYFLQKDNQEEISKYADILL